METTSVSALDGVAACCVPKLSFIATSIQRSLVELIKNAVMLGKGRGDQK